MMKHEFERLIGTEIDSEDYALIELVYTYYPDTGSKQYLNNCKQFYTDLWEVFGMRIFHDMAPRASRAKELDETIRNAQFSRAEL